MEISSRKDFKLASPTRDHIVMESTLACPPPSLQQLCLQAAVFGNCWQRQPRSIAALPSHLANALLSELVSSRRMVAAQLE